MPKARNYKAEYARYHGKPEMIKERAQRNAARAEMEKTHGSAALDGKDVHHKKAIRHGGGNGKGNLAVSSVHRNRGWEKKR
jgi:hypothetical protein